MPIPVAISGGFPNIPNKLVEAAGLTTDMGFLSRLGGFLHDIGKVSIPDGILGKRGQLTEPEYEAVKTHPGIGAALIQAHPLDSEWLLQTVGTSG